MWHLYECLYVSSACLFAMQLALADWLPLDELCFELIVSARFIASNISASAHPYVENR